MGNCMFYCFYMCPRCATCCGLPLRVGALLVGILTVVFKIIAIGVDLCLIEQTLILPVDQPNKKVADMLWDDVEIFYLYFALVADIWILIWGMVLVCGVVRSNMAKVEIFIIFFFFDTLRLIGVVLYEYYYLSPLLDTLHPMSQTICGDLAQFYVRLGIVLQIILFMLVNSYHHKLIQRQKDLLARMPKPPPRAPSPIEGQLVDDFGQYMCPCPDGLPPLRMPDPARAIEPGRPNSLAGGYPEGKTDRPPMLPGEAPPPGFPGPRSVSESCEPRSPSRSPYSGRSGRRSSSPMRGGESIQPRSGSRSPSPYIHNQGNKSLMRPIIKQPTQTNYDQQPNSMTQPQPPTWNNMPQGAYCPPEQNPGDPLGQYSMMARSPATSKSPSPGTYFVNRGDYHEAGGYSRSASPHPDQQYPHFQTVYARSVSPFAEAPAVYSRSQSPYAGNQSRSQSPYGDNLSRNQSPYAANQSRSHSPYANDRSRSPSPYADNQSQKKYGSRRMSNASTSSQHSSDRSSTSA